MKSYMDINPKTEEEILERREKWYGKDFAFVFHGEKLETMKNCQATLFALEQNLGLMIKLAEEEKALPQGAFCDIAEGMDLIKAELLSVARLVSGGEKYAENCKTILEHYGVESQLGLLQEECAEVIQAVSKARRYGLEKRKHDLKDEVRDVLVVLDELFAGEVISRESVEVGKMEKVEVMAYDIREGYASEEGKVIWRKPEVKE